MPQFHYIQVYVENNKGNTEQNSMSTTECTSIINKLTAIIDLSHSLSWQMC
jgi:hypothetical protein